MLTSVPAIIPSASAGKPRPVSATAASPPIVASDAPIALTLPSSPMRSRARNTARAWSSSARASDTTPMASMATRASPGPRPSATPPSAMKYGTVAQRRR